MINSEEEEKDRADEGHSWAHERHRNLSWKGKIKKYLGPIGIVILLLIKFGAKLKFLILPVLKFFPILLKTGGTMLISIWAYSLFWGWQFAAGFVILKIFQ